MEATYMSISRGVDKEDVLHIMQLFKRIWNSHSMSSITVSTEDRIVKRKGKNAILMVSAVKWDCQQT